MYNIKGLNFFIALGIKHLYLLTIRKIHNKILKKLNNLSNLPPNNNKAITYCLIKCHNSRKFFRQFANILNNNKTM